MMAASAECRIRAQTIGATPPDSITIDHAEQRWIREELQVWDDPRALDPFPRNLVIVGFRSGVEVRVRRAVVAEVCGELIGGMAYTTSFASRMTGRLSQCGEQFVTSRHTRR